MDTFVKMPCANVESAMLKKEFNQHQDFFDLSNNHAEGETFARLPDLSTSWRCFPTSYPFSIKCWFAGENLCFDLSETITEPDLVVTYHLMDVWRHVNA